MDTKQPYDQPYYPPNQYPQNQNPGAPQPYIVYAKPVHDPIATLPGYIKWPIKIGIVILSVLAGINGVIAVISTSSSCIIAGVVIM